MYTSSESPDGVEEESSDCGKCVPTISSDLPPHPHEVSFLWISLASSYRSIFSNIKQRTVDEEEDCNFNILSAHATTTANGVMIPSDVPTFIELIQSVKEFAGSDTSPMRLFKSFVNSTGTTEKEILTL